MALPAAIAPGCMAAPPVSVLAIQGTEDQLIPYDGGGVAGTRGAVLSALESVAHWARRRPRGALIGALLVAPADVDSELHTPPEVRGFAPLPLEPLPFPAIVVASRTDPYVAFSRAQLFADSWLPGGHERPETID